MLSRVADHIYWLARYAERAENTARLIIANSNLQLDLPKQARPGWMPLIAIAGADESFRRVLPGTPDETAVVRFLIGDAQNSSSIIQSLKCARENARTIRDFLPRDAWEQINGLFRIASNEIYLGISGSGRYEYLKRIIVGVQALNGILGGTMNHDAGYSFVRIGRNLERADMTTRIIDVLAADLMREDRDPVAYQNIKWVSVLESLSGYQMYRREMQRPIGWTPVLNFLLKSAEFPRSFTHCTLAIATALRELNNHQRALDETQLLASRVRAISPEELRPQELHEVIDELQAFLGELHQVIGESYFNATPLAATQSQTAA